MSVTYNRTRTSPNYETAQSLKQRTGHVRKPHLVTIHGTQDSYPNDVTYLCDPQPNNPDGRVSAHVYIRRTGEKFLLVPFENVAWHCYVAPEFKTKRPDIWAVWGNENSNYDSIGIECEQRAGQLMTGAQMDALVEVLTDICKTYNVVRDRVHIVGHCELKTTKFDPWVFDWDTLMTRLEANFEPEVPPTAPPQETARWYPQTGHAIQGGFFQFFLKLGEIPFCGYPLTDEFIEADGTTRQVFENVMFEWRPGNPNYPRLGAVGARYLSLKGK